MDKTIKLLNIKITKYRNDPVLFFKEVLNFEPDEWQREVANNISSYNKVTVRSGQGVGKTCLEAAVLLWFLCCFPYARVVATAPTRQQLNDVLWAEISKWQNKSPILNLILKWTKTRVGIIGYEQRWFAVARTATRPENMQGFHEKNMLFIVDEASGVADPIMEAILGTLSGENNKLLMCGNPTRDSGVFYESHTKDKEIYKCHKISSLESSRTNKENINSIIKKYGKDSNVVRVRVYGEFPIDENDVFISTSIVRSCMSSFEDEIKTVESIDIGIDVARFGDDNTVIAIRLNNTILPLDVFHGYATNETANVAIAKSRELKQKYGFNGKVYIKIDDTGVGGGVTDRIKEIRKEENIEWLVVIPINFNMSVNHTYYYDFNTVLWGNLKEILEEQIITIPNDDEIEGELTLRKKEFTSNGKIKIESKKEMKKRGLQSPDRGDAIALAVYPITTVRQNKRKEGGKRR